jgi:hypothetical protein
VNADAIIQKYWRAVDDLTNYQQDVLSDDAIRLAISLAVQDAYAAGGALADDLAAIVASQAQASPEQRVAESNQAQINRLNEWLAINAPALYHNPDLDTAAAVLAELGVRGGRMIEQSAAIVEYQNKLNELNCELVQLDADNADLTQRLRDATEEVDRLTRQNVIATDTFNSLAAERTNGAGANPTTAPGWNRNHPAWSGLPKADLDVVDQLASGATTFRKLAKTLRRDLVIRVLRSLAVDGEVKSLTYDKRKPDWMPTSGAVVMLSETGRWSNLLAMALTPV